MALGHKRQKYGNKKIVVDGIKFASILEKFMYDMLKKFDVKFEFQVPIELVPKFSYAGTNYRATNMIVDFVIEDNGKSIIVDTKGYATAEAKLKYKLLAYALHEEGSTTEIHWLSTKNDVTWFVMKMVKENQDRNVQRV